MVSPRESPPPTKAAEPQFRWTFDPWNSSSTGHQRAENRLGGSTGWRESRNTKLQAQFRGGSGDGERVSDSVGSGSKDWDPKLQAVVPPELRVRARASVADMLARPGAMRRSLSSTGSASGNAMPLSPALSGLGGSERHVDAAALGGEEPQLTELEIEESAETRRKLPRKIFEGVVVYVNGSTHPLISDLKLKQVLADHGASMSTHLGRKKVTHVILGRPTGSRSGASGSLASGKLQKEVRKLGGAAVQFVSVEWVLDSINAGKRVPEARFGPARMAAKGQQSVYGIYSQPEPTGLLDSRQASTGVYRPEASTARMPDTVDDEASSNA